MKLPSCLIASLFLNAVLIVVVGRLATNSVHREDSIHVTRLLTNRTVRIAPAEPGANPAIIEVTAPFHWAQVESADYRIYMDNLRSIGCPEETVRDIIVADVEALFAGRVRDAVAPVQGKFWQLLACPEELESVVEQKQEELRALKEEKMELFQVLLGTTDPHSDDNRLANEAQLAAGRAAQLAFVPEPGRTEAMAVLAALDAAQRALARPGHAATKAEREAYERQLREMRDEATRSLRAILAPDEFAEYRLRTSTVADARSQFSRLDISEDDMRGIARVLARKQEAESALDRKDSEFKTVQAQLARQAETEIELLLGPERFKEYQRSKDGRFDQITRVTERLGLPEETAVMVYEMRVEAETQTARLRQDKSLDAEQRKVLLAAVRDETRQSVEAVLDAKALGLLQKHGGAWIDRLAGSEK